MIMEPPKLKMLELIVSMNDSARANLCRFALPHKDQVIGLPIGQHISLKAITPAADGSEIMKPYTPVSDDDLLGYVDFVIKASEGLIIASFNCGPAFKTALAGGREVCRRDVKCVRNGQVYMSLQVYEQGRMSKHLDQLQIGDKLLFKGPRGRFKYQQNAKRALGVCMCQLPRRHLFILFARPVLKLTVGYSAVCNFYIGMVAGGTGITPMYQVATKLLKDPDDHTKV
jgi:cytochrome-b5 reductase